MHPTEFVTWTGPLKQSVPVMILFNTYACTRVNTQEHTDHFLGKSTVSQICENYRKTDKLNKKSALVAVLKYMLHQNTLL